MKVNFSLEAVTAKKLFTPLFATINHSTVLPILEDVLIENNGVLSFTATDLENILRIEQSSSGKEEFKVCLRAKKLRQMLANSIEPNITFTGDNEKLKIKSGDFNLSTILENADNYPKTPMLDETIKIVFDTKDILPFIEKAIPFISNDDLRPAMTGICFNDWKGHLYITATDAHRLYYYPIMKTPETFKGASFIISHKSSKLLILAFKNKEQVILEYEAKNKNHIRFTSDKTILSSRLINARYPDYSKVIPTDNALTFNLQRKRLIAFLKIADPFTHQSTHMLKLEVSKDKVMASGGDIDFSDEFSYSLPLYNPSIEFEKFKFAVNTKFLLQALAVSKDEYVKVNHAMSATKAMLLDDCILLMPLMLNDGM